MLDDALKYTALGFSLFPVHTPIIDGTGVRCSCSKGVRCKPTQIGKHPRTRHGLEDATSDADQIRRWWKKWADANIGIVTGPLSGFIALDIDPRHGGDVNLPALEAKLGKLPDTVTAHTGGGGEHRLFRHPGFRVPSTQGKLAPGIDVKGDIGYILVEPSLHKSGQRYSWELSSALGEVEIAKLPAKWLDAIRVDAGPDAVVSGSDCARAGFSDSDFGGSGRIACVSPILCFSVTPDAIPAMTVEEVIQATLPAHPGQRNGVVLNLARGLRFNVGIKSVAKCEPHVRRWHGIADERGLISREDDVTVTLIDFEYAFDRARLPLDVDLAKVAATAAKNQPTPPCAIRYLPNEGMVLLVKTCRELQRFIGDKPFSLSVSQAADVLGLQGSNGRTNAFRRLCALEKAGIIKCVERGKSGRAGGPATRWRFIGDQPQQIIDAARVQALTERFKASFGKLPSEPSRKTRLEQIRRLIADEK